MTLVYLLGKHGVGKYTIAQEFGKHNYRICDNQSINNPIFSLLDFTKFKKIPEKIWNHVDRIREIVFEFIADHPEENYVLTNVLFDKEEDYEIYNQVFRITEKHNTLFIPVKLQLNSRDEHLKRIQNPARKLRFKSTKVEDVNDVELIKISHSNLLEIDITNLQPVEVFDKIQIWMKNCQ